MTPFDSSSPFGAHSLSPFQSFKRFLFRRCLPPLPKSVRTAWRSKYLQSLGPRFVDVVHGGFNIRTHTSYGGASNRALVRGNFNNEKTEVATLLRTLKKCPNPIFVDLGAHLGNYAFLAARNKALVLAVEPIPQLSDALLFNARANSFPQPFLVEPVAVADHDDSMKLRIPNVWAGASLHPQHPVANDQSTFINVPVRTLLHILQKHQLPHITALKADLEGYEDKALTPFLLHSPKHLLPNLIIVENHRSDLWSHNLSKTFADAHYKPLTKTKLNLILQRSS